MPALSEQRTAAETTDDANSRMSECVLKVTEKSKSLGSSRPSTNSNRATEILEPGVGSSVATGEEP